MGDKPSGPEFLFVLEQCLGHAVHGANLERAFQARDDFTARVVRVGPGDAKFPVLRNWSVEASTKTRTELRRAFAHAVPDALYLHSQVTALLAGSFMRRVPAVISMDATPINFDSLGEGYGHRRQAAAAERAKWLLNRRVFRTARAMVTFSHWAARSLVADYGVSADRVHVIRPGVDLAHFQPDTTKDQSGPVRILFVGGDFIRKGGPELLEATRRLRGAVELDIVTASAPDDLPPDIAVRVHTGLKPNSDELLALYRRADVFVLPSRGECYGHVFAEALASGLPVVACGVGAVREMIVEGATGLLVPPASPVALTQALQSLVDQPHRRLAMGRRGLALARAEHDAGANAQAVFALLMGISTAPDRRGAQAR